MAGDEGFTAAERTFGAINMNLTLDTLTAEHFESQFWNSFDRQFSLTEVDMREKLPLFLSDPQSSTPVAALTEERTHQLAA